MRLLLFLLIIGAFIIPVFGQTYDWKSFTKDNSPLKSNNLSSLEISDDDILWIGSDSGLTGYNGSAWISYKTPSSDLTNDTVSSIQIDNETIWLGTNNGLSSGQVQAFDNITWETPYRTDNSELINNKINSINIDSLGTCWICTDSGITVITDTAWVSFSASSQFYLSNNKVLCVNKQPTFMQYIGTQRGGVCRLYFDVDGVTGASTIWKQWTGFTIPEPPYRFQPGLLSDTVKTIMVDTNGDRWYGTEHGVSSHTGKFLKNPYSWISYTTDIGLVNNNVQALAEDSTGAIWIGTSGGISKLLPVDTTWTNFTMDSGLMSNDVRDIAVAADGTVWFATSGGLSKLTIIPSAITKNKHQIPDTFDVYPTYPNPFNMSTTIKFNLASSTNIQILIYDINGRLVKNLLNSQLMAGNYKVRWDGRNNNNSYISSGVYYAAIVSLNQKSLLKLVLVK